MPTLAAEDVVLGFLDEVDRLMKGDDFEAEAWRASLSQYLNSEFHREVESRSSPLAAAALLMLRKSLGYVGE
jgi:hypothetical protein